MALKDLAQVVIEAVDKTSDGTKAAVANLQGVHGAVDGLKTKLAALGGLLGFTAFAAMVARTIEAQAKMKDLAIEAGMTVDALSQFEPVGRTSGEGLEGIASAVGKMSRALMAARDPTSAQAQALGAINLSWKDLQDLSPDEQLKRIAVAQAAFAGGTEKNAVMMEIFGKSGTKFQVALQEIAEQQEWAATTTQKQADAADAFMDALALLGLRFTKFGRQIADEVLVYLNPLLKALSELPEKSYSTLGVIDLLAGGFKYLGGIVASLWLALQDMGDAIGANMAKVAAFFRGDFDAIAAINREREENARRNEEAYTRMWNRLREKAPTQEERDNWDLMGKPRPNFNPDGGKAIKEAEALEKQFQAEKQRLQEQIVLWRERERLGRQLMDSEKALGEIEAGKYAKLGPKRVEELKLIAERWRIEQQRSADEKFMTEARAKEAEALGKEISALHEKVEAARIENETYGMTASSVARLTILRLEERRAQLLATEGAELQVKALDVQIEKMRQLANELGKGELRQAASDAQKHFAEVWADIAARGADLFTDLVMNGRNAFDSLRSFAKQLLAEMVNLFARRWILQLGATGGGVMGAGAPGSASAGFGTVTNTLSGLGTLGTAGAWLGGAMGLFTGGAAYAAAVPGLTAFGAGSQAAMLAAQTGVFGAAGTAATAAAGAGATGVGATAGTMTSVYSALASIPVWGWIAMAVIAAIAFFSGRGGGPKVGGSYFGQYDADGNLVGNPLAPTDNGRFFTPSQWDSHARQLVETTHAGYRELLRSFGGTDRGISFGLGMDADPAGDARSRLSGQVRGADGSVLWSVVDRSFDDKEIDSQVALAIQQMMLAGLQSSELPEAISDVLNLIVAETATMEDIQRIYALATAVGQLTGALAEALDPDKIIADASRTALDVFQEQGNSLRTLAGNAELTTESLGEMIQATSQFRMAAAQLILQFEQAKRMVGTSIADAIRGIRLGVMDDQGRYDFFQNEANTLTTSLGRMTDPEMINATVQRIIQASNSAFGLLSPEEQQRLSGQFISGLETVNNIATARLNTLQQQVTDDANAVLQDIKAILTEIAKTERETADRNRDTAQINNNAANTFAGAVDRGVNVQVKVDLADGYVEVQPGNA